MTSLTQRLLTGTLMIATGGFSVAPASGQQMDKGDNIYTATTLLSTKSSTTEVDPVTEITTRITYETIYPQAHQSDFLNLKAIKAADKQIRALVRDNRDLTDRQINALLVLATNERESIGCAIDLSGYRSSKITNEASIRKTQHENSNRAVRRCLVQTIDDIANQDAALAKDAGASAKIFKDRITVQNLLTDARVVFGNRNPPHIEPKNVFAEIILQ